MNKLLYIGLLLCLAMTVSAQQKVLKIYDWKDLPLPSTNCQIISMDGMSVLKIENTNDAPLEVSLLKITNSIIKKATAISSEMKYENVAFIEHTNTNPFGFSNGRRPVGGDGFGNSVETSRLIFTMLNPPFALGGDERTNGSNDYINGTSNWRPCLFMGIEGSSPDQLEFILHMVGSGTIYLRPIKLLGTSNSFDWWTPEQSGLIGGIGGSIIGCFGGLIGCLAGMGKARRFVLAMIKIFIALGILSLIAGGIAAATKQPYTVYYPLLLAGFILTIVFSVNLPSIQRRYDELEIRRMTSVDTMGS